MFVIYYLISKLFSSKSSSRTEKHFILYFKSKQIFGRTQGNLVFFFLFRGQNIGAENLCSSPCSDSDNEGDHGPYSIPQLTDACYFSLVAGVGDKRHVLVSLTYPKQTNADYSYIPCKQTSLAWLEAKKRVYSNFTLGKKEVSKPFPGIIFTVAVYYSV